MTTLKGNKGEWSEPYVLFKLLADQVLCLGDEKLNKISGSEYPIVAIYLNDGSNLLSYSTGVKQIKVTINGKTSLVNRQDFVKAANYLIDAIKINSGIFSHIESERLLNDLGRTRLKASSANKNDINVQIIDARSHQQPNLGFSIKSQLGSASTLLNASSATNFRFKVTGVNLSKVQSYFNSARSFQDKAHVLNQNKCKVTFDEVKNEIFKLNLILIDSLMPEICAQLLLKSFFTNEKSLLNLSELIEKDDPMKFGIISGHPFYSHKVKRLLSDCALGMVPSKMWNGRYQAVGGYLVVKRDGEILCYHFYYKNEFEDYLLNNTRLETASTTRHKFGSMYKFGSDYYFDLNLQIRFSI